MLLLLSPAKSLDLDSPLPAHAPTQPQFLAEASALAATARTLGAAKLKEMMGISDALAGLNAGRFNAFHTPFTPNNARPALFTFNGDVYTGFDASSMSSAALTFAQTHVRILSGLYGLLRPLDLIQPYRLEMGTALKTDRGGSLYAYWGDRLTDALNDEAPSAVINLASQEYFGAVQPKRLHAPLITPLFKEWRGNKLQVISFFAKQARGRMARFVCDQALDRVDGLKDFALDGYRFDASLSDATTWLFTRRP
jgi:uncharacterized protein